MVSCQCSCFIFVLFQLTRWLHQMTRYRVAKRMIHNTQNSMYRKRVKKYYMIEKTSHLWVKQEVPSKPFSISKNCLRMNISIEREQEKRVLSSFFSRHIVQHHLQSSLVMTPGNGLQAHHCHGTDYLHKYGDFLWIFWSNLTNLVSCSFLHQLKQMFWHWLLW